MRRRPGAHHAQFRQPELLTRLDRSAQMTEMNRIEGAPENGDRIG
jgi:hypothetical protein